MTRKFLLQLYNSIDNMPNLIDFNLSCYSFIINGDSSSIIKRDSNCIDNDDLDECDFIEENLVLRFIEKVLTLKSIKNIHIVFSFGDFFPTIKLKNLFPTINFKNYYNVEISYKLKIPYY